MVTFAGLTLSVQADGLNLDDVIHLLLQVPQHTGSAGGVHLSDKPLHFAVHSLKESNHLIRSEEAVIMLWFSDVYLYYMYIYVLHMLYNKADLKLNVHL